MNKVFPINTKLAVKLSLLSILGTSLTFATSASAFTFTSSSVTLDNTDINKSFQVFFDGNIDDAASNALNSNAIFTFLGFNTVNVGGKTRTEANFDITLNNTTTLTSTTGDFFKSRVSVLGFDITPDAIGVGSPSSSGNTRVNSGIFTNDSDGQMANAGKKEVCFSLENCAGGADGGVNNFQGLTKDSTYLTGKFNATVAVQGSVNQLNLGNFGVRYQSVDGKLGATNIAGASGTGSGIKIISYDPEPEPRKIPESSTIGAILLIGLGIVVGNKKRQSVNSYQ